MTTTRLLIFLAMACAAQAGFAATINKCKQPDGKVIMTERPCGDPAMERKHAYSTHAAAAEVEAKDAAGARKKIAKPPRSTDLIDSRGNLPPAPPAGQKGQH